MHAIDKEGDRVIIKVWDVPTRLLHWVNAALIIALILLILGNVGMESLGVGKLLRAPVKQLHAYVGHLFIITFFLRILWGFAGNTYARWGDIRPFSKEARAGIIANIRWYLGGCRSRAGSYIGHDPLAALFYTGLVFVLCSMIITGLLMSGLEFNLFPGSVVVGALSGQQAKDVHHLLK